MGRLVKCRVCKKQLDINEAYKAILYNSKGTPSNAYFCSEEHRQKGEIENKEKVDKIKENQAIADKTYYLICDIIGRKEILNTALYKERKIWNKAASDEVIGQYLEENKDYLTNVIAKLEDIEYNRIRYLSAILKNNIGDYKPGVKQFKKTTTVTQKIIPVVQEEHYETKFKSKKRKGFEDLEEEFDE